MAVFGYWKHVRSQVSQIESCVLRYKEKYWPQTELKCKNLFFRVKNYEKRTKSANDIVLTAAEICRMDTVISNWWNAGKNLHLTSKNNHFTSLFCHDIIFRQEIFPLWENFDTQTLSPTHKENFSLQGFVRKIFSL